MHRIQNPFLRHGIFNVVCHIPVLIFTSFFGLLIIGIFQLWNFFHSWTALSMLVCAIMLSPMLIPPVSCVAGIVRGIVFYRRDIYAKTCLLLSVLGIFLYGGMIVLCYILGSIA